MHFLVTFIIGLLIGGVVAIIGIYIFLIFLLPKPPEVQNFSSPTSVPAPALLSHPSVQLWVNLLPSRLMPYSTSHHTHGMTYSARMTFNKQKLVVEYPDRNILDEHSAPTDHGFLAYKEVMDMTRAKISFLPSHIKEKELFNKKFPISIEEQRQFIIFSNSSREKEDLHRALVDSSKDPVSDDTETKTETQRERRRRFLTCLDGKSEWLERGELCSCEVEPVENKSLDFLNSLTLHIFSLVRNEEFVKNFIHSKILNKLGKIKLFNQHFPDHFLETLDSGIFAPVIRSVDRPYMDSQHGLFLPVTVEYRGLCGARIRMDRHRSEDDMKTMNCVKKLKNFVLKNIGLKLDLLTLQGKLCLHVGGGRTDRL